MLNEGGNEAWRAGEKGIGKGGKGASTCDALGDKEMRGWRWRRERDGAGATAGRTCGEDSWRLGWEGCNLGAEARGLGVGKGEGSCGESWRGEFRVEERVSRMGESAKEELGSVVGQETSGMGGFMAIGVKVEGEGGVCLKGVTEGVVGGDGRVKGI